MTSSFIDSGFCGLRVVRGPDWCWGNQDGGEGFVGTVSSDSLLDKISQPLSHIMNLNEDKSALGWVQVVWDRGTVFSYRIGYQGAFDLRVVDNSSIKVFHSVTCQSCCKGLDILGMRWVCNECDASLCSDCFFKNKHDEAHTEFQRYEMPNCERVSVSRIPNKSKRIELRGIFSGARVKRGRDWVKGDEDSKDNLSKVGKVVQLTSPLEPGWIQVKWPNNDSFPYRVGAEGKVDLRLEKHASGGSYLPENLPILKSNYLEAVTNINGEIRFAVGDKVKLNVGMDKIKELQKGHGGWNPEMERIIDTIGTAQRLTEYGILVSFVGVKHYMINPAALVRMAPFSVGQPIRVKNDEKTIQSMVPLLTNPTARKLAGETGRVRKFINYNEVEVQMDGFEIDAVQTLHYVWLEIFPEKEVIRNKMTKLRTKIVALFTEAASKGQLSILKHLKNTYKLNIDEKTEDKGKTALQSACRHGQIDIVKWLVEVCKSDIEQKDNKGRTAIHHAAKGCQPSILKYLIEKGINIDAVCMRGFTALQFATTGNCIKCIRLLIKNSCQINIPDSDGDTVLNNAILQEAKSPVYINHEIVDELLKKSDLKQTNKRGLNSLLLAAMVKNKRVLKEILTHHGDTLAHLAEKNLNATALHLSCMGGDLTSVRIFCNYVAQRCNTRILELRCKNEMTPLHVAALRGDYGIVELLVKSKAQVNAKDEDGDTAVHLVAIRLEVLHKKPTHNESPEVFKIYQELEKFYPGLVDCYPALSLMCFLVRKGCPWRKPFSKQSNKIINNEAIHEVLTGYCPDGEIIEPANLINCILCSHREKPAGCIRECGHESTNICQSCIFQVQRCPACFERNGAFNSDERNQQTAKVNIFPETDYNKQIYQPTASLPTANTSFQQGIAQPRGCFQQELPNTSEKSGLFLQPSTSQQLSSYIYQQHPSQLVAPTQQFSEGSHNNMPSYNVSSDPSTGNMTSEMQSYEMNNEPSISYNKVQNQKSINNQPGQVKHNGYDVTPHFNRRTSNLDRSSSQQQPQQPTLHSHISELGIQTTSENQPASWISQPNSFIAAEIYPEQNPEHNSQHFTFTNSNNESRNFGNILQQTRHPNTDLHTPIPNLSDTQNGNNGMLTISSGSAMLTQNLSHPSTGTGISYVTNFGYSNTVEQQQQGELTQAQSEGCTRLLPKSSKWVLISTSESIEYNNEGTKNKSPSITFRSNKFSVRRESQRDGIRKIYFQCTKPKTNSGKSKTKCPASILMVTGDGDAPKYLEGNAKHQHEDH